MIEPIKTAQVAFSLKTSARRLARSVRDVLQLATALQPSCETSCSDRGEIQLIVFKANQGRIFAETSNCFTAP
jgi:hypothetical protein